MSGETPTVPEASLLYPVRDNRYGVVIRSEVIDSENFTLLPEFREVLERLFGNTVNSFIHNRGPEGNVRLTLTLEAL